MRLAKLLIAALLALAPLPSGAAEHINPERGFWRFIAEDFASASSGEIAGIREGGLSVGYAIVRLDDYRDSQLPAAFLKALDRRFALARKAGIKVILRFAYNYPDDEQSYRNAKDASLDKVLQHIRQLKPVVARNADVIAVWQAGFIGAWGEGHTSSNGLDKPGPKRIIRDALLSALPQGRKLQWRYPGDLIAWGGDAKGRRAIRRIGIHNDCFMSSPTDVGTYSENAARRARERAFVADHSATTPFGGETCGAEPAKIRSSCRAIREESALFHLSLLNRDYYAPFFRRWQREGCLGEIAGNMGYRLGVKTPLIPVGSGPGDIVSFYFSVENRGFAAPFNPRRLDMLLVDSRGRVVARKTAIADISGLTPGKERFFKVGIRIPANQPDGKLRLKYALPDPAPSLADDPRYAIALDGLKFETATGWNDDDIEVVVKR